MNIKAIIIALVGVFLLNLGATFTDGERIILVYLFYIGYLDHKAGPTA